MKAERQFREKPNILAIKNRHVSERPPSNLLQNSASMI